MHFTFICFWRIIFFVFLQKRNNYVYTYAQRKIRQPAGANELRGEPHGLPRYVQRYEDSVG